MQGIFDIMGAGAFNLMRGESSAAAAQHHGGSNGN